MSLFARLLPLLVGLVFLGLWQAAVDLGDVPLYILPSPGRIALTLWRDRVLLGASLWFTLKVTLAALAAAVLGGGGLAVLFARSPLIERSLYPYAVILQVTPIVAIAPLIIIWVDHIWAALLICAWIVAFFPILSNTSLGLHSTDPNLESLFKLYGARPWQRLRYLALPSALPYFLGGLRISGGLALIGAVVAEFVAGAGGRESGLAYRILEAGYRLDIPRMFAALFLISATGIALFGLLSALSRLILRDWHDSSVERDHE